MTATTNEEWARSSNSHKKGKSNIFGKRSEKSLPTDGTDHACSTSNKSASQSRTYDDRSILRRTIFIQQRDPVSHAGAVRLDTNERHAWLCVSELQTLESLEPARGLVVLEVTRRNNAHALRGRGRLRTLEGARARHSMCDEA